jgi:hypothetical protein
VRDVIPWPAHSLIAIRQGWQRCDCHFQMSRQVVIAGVEEVYSLINQFESQLAAGVILVQYIILSDSGTFMWSLKVRLQTEKDA